MNKCIEQATGFNTKPEPIAAQPNWHYDLYFIARLQRLDPHKLENATQKRRKVSIRLAKSEIEFEN